MMAMKGNTILSSILLGLTLPTYAFANVSIPTSFSHANKEKLNEIKAVEIAQNYIAPQLVSQRLYNSQAQVLGIASQYSGDQVRWDNISVEYPNAQQIKLNIHGKIHKPGKDAGIRIGLFFNLITKVITG